MLVLVSKDYADVLPPLRLTDGDAPEPCPGWQLLSQIFVSVVDGPGDAGFLVEGVGDPAGAEQRFTWLEDVERAGGAVVAVVPDRPEGHDAEALTAAGARGGFVAANAR